MPNRTIDIEVDKIYHPQATSKQAALACARVCGHLQGFNLKLLDVQKKSSLADYFLIADARNSVQARSMADEITRQLKRLNMPRLSREGDQGEEWVLLDAGSVIVHIFVEPAREHYQLDELYSLAPPVPIPKEYYLTSGRQTPLAVKQEVEEYI